MLAQRHRGFVDAARALGRTSSIALRHVLPNTLTPALIQASVTIGFAILMDGGPFVRRRRRAAADAGRGLMIAEALT